MRLHEERQKSKNKDNSCETLMIKSINMNYLSIYSSTSHTNCTSTPMHLLAKILNTIYRPKRYTTSVGTYAWNVEKEEGKHREACYPNYNAVHLLYAYGHHASKIIILHESAEIKVSQVKMSQGQLTSVTHHVIVEEVHEQLGIESVPKRTCKIHVEDIEYKQSHEKMLKVMERLVKRPHEGGSKNGIGTTAYDGRQAELFYIHIHVDGKIHQYGVNKDTGKAYGK